MEDILKGLTQTQKEAVTHGTGPLLIVAGAGSGKTEVLTKRFAYLVSQGVSPQSILALTFTEKAAQEMLERIDTLIPIAAEEPYISTFHSFCDRLLRDYGLEIGLDTGYKIIDEAAAWILLRKNIFALPLSYFRPTNNPTKFIGAFLEFISRAKDENISPEDYENYAKKLPEKTEEEKTEKEKQLELAKLYSFYQNLLAEQNALDFGALILNCLKLLTERPNIRKKISNRFKYILVDEFQDTNYAQNELLKLLTFDHQNITVVGDDDQAIYRFRGASVQNILDFTRNYPDAKKIVLVDNFRNKQEILDKAYHLIQNNNPNRLEEKIGITKKLKAMRGKGAVLEIIHAANIDAEVEAVIQKIENLINQSPELSFKDIAILARTNAALDNFANALRAKEIPFQVIASRGLFGQEEISDIIAFLRLLLNKNDNINLFRVLSARHFKIVSSDLVSLLASAKNLRISLFEAIQNPQIVISPETRAGLTKFLKLFNDLQNQLTTLSSAQIIHNYAANSGLLSELTATETISSHLSVENLNLFLKLAQNFESNSGEKLLPAFMEYLEFLLEAQEDLAAASFEDLDVIKLSTVHSAKGLEFRVVFLVNLSSEHFPARRKSEAIELPSLLIKENLPERDVHIEEERRLFYVALTRAKDYLFLSYSDSYGSAKKYKCSIFLKEIFAEQELLQTPKMEQPLPLALRKDETFDFLANLKQLSYTALETFDQCPLKFKYKYIWGLVEPPSAATTFGNNVHNTLRYFCEDWQKGIFKDKKGLLEIYERVWKREGFIDDVQEKEYKEQGKHWLLAYYDNYLQKMAEPPVFLEKNFLLSFAGIPIKGKIDRVDKTSEGWEVIDYKTGSEKDPENSASNLQLSIYALGLESITGELPKKTSFVYLKSGNVVSLTPQKKDLEKVEEQVRREIERIKSGEFPPKKNYFCSNCPFRPLCPLWNV